MKLMDIKPINVFDTNIKLIPNIKNKLSDNNQGLKYYLDARDNLITTYSTEYVLSALWFMGYTLHYENSTTKVCDNQNIIKPENGSKYDSNISQDLLDFAIKNNFDKK